MLPESRPLNLPTSPCPSPLIHLTLSHETAACLLNIVVASIFICFTLGIHIVFLASVCLGEMIASEGESHQEEELLLFH